MPDKNKRAKRPSFYQLIIEGSPKMIRGFLAGFQLGREATGEIFFHFLEGIHEEGLPKKLAELIRLHPRDCHLIVDTDTRKALVRIASRMEKETGLRIQSSRFIRSASFTFSFQAYARRYGVEILSLLNNLPDSLRLLDFKKKEKVRPDAAGVEAYAPAHDYEIEGSGKITGRIDLVIAARRRLDEHPLVKPAEIVLSLA